MLERVGGTRPRGKMKWWRVMITGMITAVLFCEAVCSGEADPIDQAAALIARSRTALGPGLAKVKSIHFAGSISAGSINGTRETWVDLPGGTFCSCH